MNDDEIQAAITRRKYSTISEALSAGRGDPSSSFKTIWRLCLKGVILGEYSSELDALEAREAMCGINYRDDYVIYEIRT